MPDTHESSSKLKIILPLGMVIFIDTFAMTLVYPLFAPLFSLDMAHGGIIAWDIAVHVKDILYGLTMAVYPLFMFFTAPLLGDFSDQIGRKKVLLFCLLGAGFAACLSGVAVIIQSFWLFFISRMIAGGVAGSLPVAQAAITDISDERNKTVNIGLISFAYTFGVVFGPIVGGLLSNKDIISWFSFDTPFFVTTLLAISNALILIFTFKETLAKVSKINWEHIHFLKPLIMFAQALRASSLRNVILVCFFYMVAWSMYLPFIALHLFQKYQFTPNQIGYFVGWVGLILSVTMLFIIRILVRYFSTLQILYGGIVLSIAGIVISMIPEALLQWIGAIPIACGMGLAYATIITFCSDVVAKNLQGWIMGVSTSAMAAAAGIGGLLVGVVSANSTIAFMSIILIWAISFGFAMRIKG